MDLGIAGETSLARNSVCDDLKERLARRCQLDRIVRAIVLPDEGLSSPVKATIVACSNETNSKFTRTIAASSAAETSDSIMLLDQYFGLSRSSQLFSAKILAHAADDLSRSSDEFHSKASAIQLQCLSTAPSSMADEYRKHTVWLTERSHCKSCFFASPMTQTIISVVRDLLDAAREEDALVYIGLVYYYGNSRKFLYAYKDLCKLRGRALYVALFEHSIEQNQSLTNCTSFPVSSGSGYRGGRAALEGLKLDEINMKVVAMATYYITVLLDEFGRRKGFCMEWKSMVDRMRCSDLQAMCVARMTKRCLVSHGYDDQRETWTHMSIHSVPVCWRKKSPRVYGLCLLDQCMKYEIGRTLRQKWEATSPFSEEVFLGESHVGQQACEIRKSMSQKSFVRNSAVAWWD